MPLLSAVGISGLQAGEDVNRFKTSPTADMAKYAAPGDTFVFSGHSASVTSAFFRAGKKFTTNRAWLVYLRGSTPEPVTIITITE